MTQHWTNTVFDAWTRIDCCEKGFWSVLVWCWNGLILGYRLRRWPNIKPPLAQHLVPAGLPVASVRSIKSTSKDGSRTEIINKRTLDNSSPPLHVLNLLNYWRKMRKNSNKSVIFNFLPAIIELVRELVISSMHNKFGKDTCKNFQVIAPTSKC